MFSLEYIKNKNSTSDFTKMIDKIVEQTKENQAFRGDYMAWGLAEQDAEKRGYKAGILDGAYKNAIETVKKALAMQLTFEDISKLTNLPLETIEQLSKIQNTEASL